MVHDMYRLYSLAYFAEEGFGLSLRMGRDKQVLTDFPQKPPTIRCKPCKKHDLVRIGS